MRQSPSTGGTTTEIETTQIEVRDNAYWPDDALLADFAEKDDGVEQAEQLPEDDSEYATLYFMA